MRRLRAALGLPAGTVAYSFRHTFTTDGLTRGVNTATMAELLGNRDTGMIDRHYGHLDQRAEHLRESLTQARAEKKEAKQPAARQPRKRKTG
jgi:integrase